MREGFFPLPSLISSNSHLHAVVVLVAAVPLPLRLGNEGPEVGVAHVADVGGEPEKAPSLEGVVVPALVPQPVGLVGQAVLLHRTLSIMQERAQIGGTSWIQCGKIYKIEPFVTFKCIIDSFSGHFMTSVS